MTVIFQFTAYLSVLLFALVCSMTGFHRKIRSLQMIVVLLACTVVSELIAFSVSSVYHNNMPVYYCFAPVELALLALYYNEVIPLFRTYRVGWIIAGAGIIIAGLNAWLRPLTDINNGFLLFEGLIVMTMALMAMHHLLSMDLNIRITGNIHFWLSLIFLVFWCGTLLIWAFIKGMIALELNNELQMFYTALWMMNMITYTGIGMVFLLLRDKNKSKV